MKVWPFFPGRPSITNLVPTGKRLGNRLKLAMCLSIAFKLAEQCVGTVTRSLMTGVVHVIPKPS